jgi:amino acid transporter/L-ascorbate metabolism protein UlaG (beta-lactamase superfamily)
MSGEPLLRAIGTFGLAAAIVNITVGGGIFRLPSSVASSLGAAAPIAYVVCAVAMGLIVLCIADAGSRVSLTGGPYAYVGAALGPYAAFLSGVLLWMLGLFATAAVATVFAASVGQLVPGLAPWEPHVLLVTFGFWSLVNMRGVALGARLNAVATVAKLLPLLLIAVGGLFLVRGEHLTVTAWPSAADVARTSLLLVFAFAGVESALVPSGEVRDTARTVPRAIALAMLGITALYIALQVSAQGILGPALGQASTPLADAAGAAFGGWARALLLAGAAISMFGYLGGMTLSVPRIVFALARDGYLPRALAAVHPIHRTPQAAIVVQTVLALVLAISGTFERLAILANVSALALYLGCAVAAWRLRSTAPAGATAGARLPLAGVAPFLAVPVILWLLTGLTGREWLGFGACIAVASVVYLLARGRRLRSTFLTLAAMLATGAATGHAQRPAPDVVPAAGGGITLAPITHATLQIRHGATIILVDPARFTPGAPLPFTPQPGKLPELPPGITPRDPLSMWPVKPGQLARFDGLAAPTIILVTDEHDDHLDPKAIDALRTPATIVVGPAVVAARVPGTIVMANGETRTIGGVGIEAVPMYNLAPEPGFTEVFHSKGRGNGYVLILAGKRIYLAGDTACTAEVKALRRIDVAFLPMNLPFTMSAADAAACARAFAPGIVYPYHSSGTDVAAFARVLDGTGIEVRVRDWYAK